MFRSAFVVLLLPVVDLCAQQAPAGREPFALSRVARDGDRFRMLLRQIRADEPALGDRHEAGRREAMAEYQGSRDLPAAHWVWVKPYWFLFRDGPDEQPATRSWGAEQACGEPDTKEAGDRSSAWATLEQDAVGEWLLLEYSAPVRATKLEVHECFNPGALASVSILDPTGEELEVWRAPQVAAAGEASRVLRIDLPLGFTVERLKLRLRSDLVAGWNEIDAVGLHDDKGKVHWAARAEASSTYADAQGAPAGVGGFAVRRRLVAQLALQPVQLPAMQLQLPAIQVPRQALNVQLNATPRLPLKLGGVQQGLLEPLLDPQLGGGARRLRAAQALPGVEPLRLANPRQGNGDEAALRAKVAELEARIAALQQELDRLRK